MQIYERIRCRMAALNIKSVDIVAATGVSKGTVSNWINGGTDPNGENLVRLAACLRTTEKWLQTGKGTPEGDSAEEIGRYNITRTVSIPLYNAELSAGVGAHIDTDAVTEFVAVGKEILEQNHLSEDAVVAARVRGDSMLPRIMDGDTILINTADKRPRDGQVYAIAVDHELKVKRLLRKMDGSWIISSDNKADPSYRDETISAHNFEQLRMIGRVVMIVVGTI